MPWGVPKGGPALATKVNEKDEEVTTQITTRSKAKQRNTYYDYLSKQLTRHVMF